MSSLVLILRLAVTAVFVASAAGKLGDLRGTRTAVREFGAPRWLAGPAAIALIVAELAAVVLLLSQAAIWGAAVALALLAVFSLAVAVNLARGRRPRCHCFGQRSTAPIGAGVLIRNAVIASAAIAIVVLGRPGPGPSPIGWIAALSGTALALLSVATLAIAVLALGGRFALGILRQNGRLLHRIDRLEDLLHAAGIPLPDRAPPQPAIGLAPGDLAPAFTVPRLAGGERTLAELLAPGRLALLVFTHATCAPCDLLAPTVRRWQHEDSASLVVAILAAGDRSVVAIKAARHDLAEVLHDQDGAVATSFRTTSTPAAVLVGPGGTIASWVAEGGVAIEALHARALAGDHHKPAGLPVGTPMPAFALPDLDGAIVPIADRLAAEAETLFVFWNPGCGYCRAMHGELRALEDRPGKHGRAVIVVATGDLAAIREEGFRSPTLRDPGLVAAAELEVSGTPIGLLIGPDATIRSSLAVGAEQILALAARAPAA